MRVYLSILIISLLCFGQTLLPARNYGGWNSDRALALVEARDSGYVMAGWTKSFGQGTPNTKNLLIVKTDKYGLPQRAIISIGGWDEEVRSMVKTSDGGYALTGFTNSYGVNAPNFTNIFVIKLDASLNLQWSRVYGGNFDDTANSIIQTQDSGYAVCGWTNSYGPAPYPNFFVLKLAANGTEQWFQVYNFPTDSAKENAYSLTQINHGYVVVGRFKSFYDYDAFIQMLGPNGEPWGDAWIIPGQNTDEAHSVCLIPPDTVAVAGWTNSYGSGDADIFVAKFINQGNYLYFLWNRVLGWEGEEKVSDDRSLTFARGLVGTRRGPGLVVSGWTKSRGPGIPKPNFLIFKLRSDGTLDWTRIHPSANGKSEEAYPVIQKANYYFATAGWSDSITLGQEDFRLLVLNAYGNRSVCVLRDTLRVKSLSFDTLPVYFRRDSLFVTSLPLKDTLVYTLNACSIPRWLRIPPPTLTRPIGSGGSITAVGSELFLLPGNNTNAFLKYSFEEENWTSLPDLPLGLNNKKGKKGACMIDDDPTWKGVEGEIYVLKGAGTNEFYKFSAEKGGWDSTLPQPNFTKGIRGGFMTYGELGNNRYLYVGSGSNNSEYLRFNLQTNQWERPTPPTLPCEKAKIGSGFAYDGQGRLYFLQGGARQNYFWYCDLQAKEPQWQKLESLPLAFEPGGRKKKVKEGGAIEFLDGRIYAVKGGNTKEMWCYEPEEGKWRYFGEVGGGAATKGIKCGKSLAGLSPQPDPPGLVCLIGNKTNEIFQIIDPDPPLFALGEHLHQGKIGKTAKREVVAQQNPVRGLSTISYNPILKEKVRLRVYNVLGELVYSERGYFPVKNLPTGIYLLRLEAKGYKEEKKLIIVK